MLENTKAIKTFTILEAYGLKLILGILIACFYSPHLIASEKVYQQYLRLNRNLSDTTNVQSFIDDNNYLSDRLRKKWLAYLAKKQQWQAYIAAYQPTNNVTRQCYYLTAIYKTDDKNLNSDQIKKLWLTGKTQPKACQYIFEKWQSSEFFSDEYIWQRIQLAIQKKNIRLVRNLQDLLPQQEQSKIDNWIKVFKNPTLLSSMQFDDTEHSNDIIVSALKRWIRSDMDAAIDYWNTIKTDRNFSAQQKQDIYQDLALYAALRNRADANDYFNQLDPQLTPLKYYEWQIRAALKKHNWQSVLSLIEKLPEPLRNKSCWQYWYARSFQKMGQEKTAQALYAPLSEKRNYYGFLASHYGDYPMNMEHETYKDAPELLEPHTQQITYINQLYRKQNYNKANLISYELANNLSQAGQYQLARKYADWKWHDKALMLANLSDHSNDLNLRFPLAHSALVEKYAEKYQVNPALIFAIIRQESTFRKKVKSNAGALGLMQVIPSTARKMSRIYKIPLGSMRQMYQAKTNLKIGTAYVSHLSKRFNQHPILIAAAYNAGPRQVNYWLKKFPETDTDLWIETLPWNETRNYLKNITSFYVVYQYRLNEKPTLTEFMKKF